LAGLNEISALGRWQINDCAIFLPAVAMAAAAAAAPDARPRIGAKTKESI